MHNRLELDKARSCNSGDSILSRDYIISGYKARYGSPILGEPYLFIEKQFIGGTVKQG